MLCIQFQLAAFVFRYFLVLTACPNCPPLPPQFRSRRHEVEGQATEDANLVVWLVVMTMFFPVGGLLMIVRDVVFPERDLDGEHLSGMIFIATSRHRDRVIANAVCTCAYTTCIAPALSSALVAWCSLLYRMR
jgi:hypothetical protein